jgi:membrane protease YdiL (CAAX protease family)
MMIQAAPGQYRSGLAKGVMMKNRATTFLWAGLIAAGAILLWRLAMAASAIAPLPSTHGARLAFGLIVTSGVVAFTIAALRFRREAPWMRLNRAALFHAGIGFAGYAGVAFLAIFALVLIGLADLEVTASQNAALSFAYLLALVFLSEALPEELLFRGWVMQMFGGRRSPWTAVLGQAALFTLFAWAVGAVASLDDASFIVCFGLVLGIIRAATGTIWTSVGVHVGFIAAQQSALPQWAIWTSSPHEVVQTVGLAIVPFSIIVAVLFDRVNGRTEQAMAA